MSSKIKSVAPRGAAARAGVRGSRYDGYGRLLLGDVIVGLNGAPIASDKDLYRSLEDKRIGETVTLTLLRAGRRIELKVSLQGV